MTFLPPRGTRWQRRWVPTPKQQAEIAKVVKAFSDDEGIPIINIDEHGNILPDVTDKEDDNA